MYFLIHHVDREHALEVRLANRGAHLEYIKDFDVLLAGPTLSEDGERMTGSVIVLDLSDRAAAQAFVANDPYTKAGLFRSSTVERWRKVIPPE